MKKRKRKLVKTKSIKTKLLFPVAVILALQMVFTVLFYQYGGVMSQMRTSSVQMLQERAKHNRMSMEQELIIYWINGVQDSAKLTKTIEKILQEENCTSEEIKTNSELNRKIISGVTEQLIEILHFSIGNGMYLVLDGPASVSGDPKEQAGIFIRDLDASSYALDYSDLLLERGLPSIAREYGIALDSFWEMGFQFDKMVSRNFYKKPFNSAKELHVQQKDASACAYLGVMKEKAEDIAGNLTYSIPLILSDNTVIGVVGGEVAAGRVRQFLADNMQEDSEEILNLLVKSVGDDPTFDVMISEKAQREPYFGKNTKFTYKESEWDSIVEIEDLHGDTWYAAIEPMKIYGSNTPFSNEQWLVVRMQKEQSLFAASNHIRRMLIFSATFSMLLSLGILLVTSHVITNPLHKMMRQIQKVQREHSGEKPYLEKVQIREVDELIDEVNRLSSSVAEHASKVSRILDTLDMEIGVFEYEAKSKEVFCSYFLLKLFEIPCEKGDYRFMDEKTFLKKILQFKSASQTKEGKIYEFNDGKDVRYIRMKLMGNKTTEMTGVLLDVTQHVNERKRLEKERDCDLLTGLYNRGGFQKMAIKLLDSERDSCMAFVMWDMDNLKYVNDTYGHELGDRYIRCFADNLRTLEHEGAIVGRRSGDEFMALLYNGSKWELWDRIRSFMEQLKTVTMRVPDGEVPLRASAGVAWYPKHSDNFDDLMRYADFAMYMSKHSYKGIVQEFDAETYQTNAYLLTGREELNQILDNHNVQFALQPIVERNGQFYGYEVLMRPKLTKLKNISELLHLAKLQAKLPQFEELTWCSALAWIKERRGQLAPNTRLFINSISSTILSEKIRLMLEEKYAGLLNRIVLELTETEEADSACLDSKISTVRRWGSLLALDDYGTGYSNEATLLKLEPDLVKMDLSLVRDIHIKPNQQTIAKNLVAYCHPRNILVLAEGVETKEEMEYLMKIQVDLFQGYYVARPSIEIISELDPNIVREMQELNEKGKLQYE